ncbi:MAG: rod shape-determining protein MreB [Clostridia bacterium]|nr:rod shape-determining protein MreB [Clostridia bacterium]
MFNFGQDVGIDLGTATVLVYVKGKGVVLKEPSVVAIDTNTGKVLKVGSEAQNMIGRTPGNIVAIRPLKDGVISDYDTTEKMLRYFLKKVCKTRFFKPKVIVCVPSQVTAVEERAVCDAAVQAGAGKTFIIEEPIAAAIGAGIDISKPHGNMIVDIGGGTADVAVISLGEIVVSNSIKVAGDKFDEAVVRYIRKKHNMMIGDRTAEELKIELGCVYPRPISISKEIKGRCLITGLPKVVTVTSEEMLDALEECASQIVDAVRSVLEKTPPELVGDISTSGILLTGGGSLIYGLDKLLARKTGLEVSIAEDAVYCVAKGTGMSLDYIDSMKQPNRR